MNKSRTKHIGQMVYNDFSARPSGLGWIERFSLATSQYTIHWQDGSTTYEYYLFVLKCRDKYLDLREKLK
jgi:hypothetical protein